VCFFPLQKSTNCQFAHMGTRFSKANASQDCSAGLSKVVPKVGARLLAETRRLVPESEVALSDANPANLAFFVGAGISMDSGLPNFRRFSLHMLQNAISPAELPNNELEMLVEELRPEVLMQTMHEQFGDLIFDFYDWFEGTQLKPAASHYVLANALHQGHMVLTTNVDDLIERAYKDLFGKAPKLIVSEEDFIKLTKQSKKSWSGALLKFHGTIDSAQEGPSRFATVRFLLNQVGQGVTTAVKKVLSRIVTDHDIVYLGYSACDNFSVQPVLSETFTKRMTIWFWFEPDKATFEEDHSRFVDELDVVGTEIAQGRSYSEIPRSMETISTLEILIERNQAFRIKTNTSTVLEAVMEVDAPGRIHIDGPVPEWTVNVDKFDAVICAASLFRKASDIERAIELLEIAAEVTEPSSEAAALAQKRLGEALLLSSVPSATSKALKKLESALEIYESLDDEKNIIDVKLEIANVHRRRHDYPNAIGVLRAIQIPETSDAGEPFFLRAEVRKLFLQGLVLGLRGAEPGPDDPPAINLLEMAVGKARSGGFPSLLASVLNSLGLVKYQAAGNDTNELRDAEEKLSEAFRLNLFIGDARSCFQQMRNLGLIHAKLARLDPDKKEEHLDKAIDDFKRAERFLGRLSNARVVGELLEARFRLGETLVAAGRLKDAEPVLADVQKGRVETGDWHNEARALELLLQTTDNASQLETRVERIVEIYISVQNSEEKLETLRKYPIRLTNAIAILKAAAQRTDQTKHETQLQTLLDWAETLNKD